MGHFSSKSHPLSILQLIIKIPSIEWVFMSSIQYKLSLLFAFSFLKATCFSICYWPCHTPHKPQVWLGLRSWISEGVSGAHNGSGMHLPYSTVHLISFLFSLSMRLGSSLKAIDQSKRILKGILGLKGQYLLCQVPRQEWCPWCSLEGIIGCMWRLEQ